MFADVCLQQFLWQNHDRLQIFAKVKQIAPAVMKEPARKKVAQ